VYDGHPRVVQPIGEKRRITGRREDVAHSRLGERVDDGRVLLPALDHQVSRDRPVGQLADAMQVLATLGGQRLDHAEAARLRDGGGKLHPGDVGHRRLDDRILNAEQRLDAI